MKHYKFCDLKEIDHKIIKELKTAACEVIDSGWYVLGSKVKTFENQMAALCHTKHAIGVSNGLDALRLILRGYIELGIMKQGDEIIVPANTYVAGILAVTDCQLIPVFVEPDPLTMNLDSSLIEEKINRRTRGIMVVHLYGSPCWNQEVMEIAKTYNLKIIEDNAQAIGAISSASGLNGTNVTGGLGDAAANSFYPTKNLGALGDAGAVTTNDSMLAKAISALMNYGSDYRYHNIYKGLNCRLDEIQAAMLSVKLKYLDAENKHRQKIANIYNLNITNPCITLPMLDSESQQVWHQYPIRTIYRDELRDYLKSNGVDTDILYPTPPHKQPCYSEFSHLHLPITENICNTIICIPVTSITSTQDAIEISEIINNFKA